ncbi:uncharacterized protein LOC129760046 [Uranotaenia lowii]|uniref:uncharacterized protein LOC129760046 n=1 Tax=Uranotaenia lowii TaxID=190385 RepID=UPI002479E654|nr:uncharacterized protein LOC129760046 [Uranotaenia lowii]
MSSDKVLFQNEKLKLSVSKFGHLKGPAESTDESKDTYVIHKYTWQTANHFQLEVITLDAAIVSLQIPNRNLEQEETILGCGDLRAYQYYHDQKLTSSVQSAVLRKCTELRQRIWTTFVSGPEVIFINVLRDRERNLIMRVRFQVTFNNFVKIGYEIVSDRIQSLELNHRFVLNLGGYKAASCGTYDHVVQADAIGFYPVKKDHFRQGPGKNMSEDLADLRVAQHVGMAIYGSDKEGFNGLYRLRNVAEEEFNLRLIHVRTGRVLEVYSDFEWMRLSSLNDLPDPCGTIVPFYACMGVKDIAQIFDFRGLVDGIVHTIEGDDVEPSESSPSISSGTIDESEIRVLIDDVLLRNIEHKVRELREARILRPHEARRILADLLMISLDKVSESTTDSMKDVIIGNMVESLVTRTMDGELAQTVIDELIDGVVCSISPSQLSAIQSQTTVGSPVQKTASLEEEEEPLEPLHEYEKHSGLLLQFSKTPFLKPCNAKSIFSKINHHRNTGMLFQNSVLLKFGLCKMPSN